MDSTTWFGFAVEALEADWVEFGFVAFAWVAFVFDWATGGTTTLDVPPVEVFEFEAAATIFLELESAVLLDVPESAVVLLEELNKVDALGPSSPLGDLTK